MPTLAQFANRLKMRHDYSDMIQVRYIHPDGETFDTWISGEEVLSRLKTASREQLIRSFSTMKLDEAKSGIKHEIEAQKDKQKQNLKERLAGKIEEAVGGNIFGDTLADNIRGVDSTVDPNAKEKAMWQSRLEQRPFRAIAIELAWFNLKGSLPEESPPEPDDWV